MQLPPYMYNSQEWTIQRHWVQDTEQRQTEESTQKIKNMSNTDTNKNSES